MAHQAFFFDDDEKTRAVELLRRAEDYESCSLTAAVRGGATRRRGYAFMYGNGDWEAIQACHEKSMREAMDEVLAEREKEERAVKGRSALLLAKGLVERTDPAHPQSPQQKYRLVE